MASDLVLHRLPVSHKKATRLNGLHNFSKKFILQKKNQHYLKNYQAFKEVHANSLADTVCFSILIGNLKRLPFDSFFKLDYHTYLK